MRTLGIIGIALPLVLWGQQGPVVHAQLERPDIRIGEQVILRLHAPADGPIVQWPVVGDTLNAMIEVVHDSGVDTVEADGMGSPSTALATRALTITSFDTGYWAIPPLRFKVGGSDMETEPLLLHVLGVPIDSTGAPRPYAPLIEPPFGLLWFIRDHWPWIAGIGGLGLIAALIVLVLRRRKKAEIPTAAPEIPMHERYLAALEALSKERLWQQGEHKVYQSRLTDLLRAYIEERYGVPALERTTDELMHELRVSPLNHDQQQALNNMLRLADLVKFAKATPTAQENEQLMVSAQRFIQETVPAQNQPDATR